VNRIFVTLLAALCTVGAFFMSALPASAAAINAGQSSVVQSPAPEISNFLLYIDTLPPGGDEPYPCNHGTSTVINGSLEDGHVQNNCDVRVWMYQNTNETGYNICVNPKTGEDINRTYYSIYISTNTAKCG
jgi:hypothetical protein